MGNTTFCDRCHQTIERDGSTVEVTGGRMGGLEYDICRNCIDDVRKVLTGGSCDAARR